MSKDLLCFIHIERAGGTTIHHLLHENFPFSYITLSPRFGKQAKYGYEFTAKQLLKLKRIIPIIKGIGGHTTRAYLEYEKTLQCKVFYFTFLRNPLSRYISHFNFQRYKKKINWTPEEFFSREEFKNLQTTRIAGGPDLEKAKYIFKNKFSFIGITERFDESILLLNNLLNDKLNLQYLIRNPLPINVDISNDLYNNYCDLIKANNHLDIELYKFALEIFNEKINENSSWINDALKRLRQQNKVYKTTRFLTNIKKLNKGIIRNFIEPYISNFSE